MDEKTAFRQQMEAELQAWEADLDELDRGGDLAALRPKMEQLWDKIRSSIARIKQWA